MTSTLECMAWPTFSVIFVVGMIDFWAWSVAAFCVFIAIIGAIRRHFQQKLNEERGWQAEMQKKNRKRGGDQ